METRISSTPENQRQLAKILDSRAFRRATTQRRLLRYVAEQTMQGRCDSLDQKSIAATVFGGHGAVSGVGLTALRVRASLRKYYDDEGRDDPIVFRMPERSFCITSDLRAQSGSSFFLEREESHGISVHAFRELLESLSELEGIGRTERNDRVRKWVAASGRFSRQLNLGQGADDCFKEFFEHLLRTGEHLTFSQMRSLTLSLGVHPIMLDPLFSEQTDDDCLVLRFPPIPGALDRLTGSGNHGEGEFMEAWDPREKHYGKNVQYWIPSKRLSSTDAYFVHLTLEPFGRSDDHHHPGDELMLVIKGSVQVQFPDSGVTIDLHEGSYAHFHAEHNHSAWNTSEDRSHLFIIRFYQLGVPDTRQEMRRELWQIVARSDSTETGKLRRLTWGWIIHSAAGRSVKLQDGIPNEVLNSLGLARLLNRWPAPKVGRARRLLSRIRQDTGKSYDRLADWLWHVETNQVRIPKHLIPAIAECYQVFDLLLVEFLFPDVAPQVVVSRNINFGGATRQKLAANLRQVSDWATMADVAVGLPEFGPPAGVTYEIPRRSLTCSDIAVTWVTLDPGMVTPLNRHKGCELLLPLEGEATLEYGRQTQAPCRISALQECAHYSSETEHRVCNYTNKRLQMFVIRFYGEDRSRKPHRPPDIGSGRHPG